MGEPPGRLRLRRLRAALQRRRRAAARRAPGQHLHHRPPDRPAAGRVGGPDGARSGGSAERYSAAGAPLGGDVRVNTYTTGRQSYPAVALAAAGDFVVVWQSYGQDVPNAYGVYAQRYSAAGVA